MAAWVLIAFSCYLRPFEAQSLRGASLVPPVAGAPGRLASWGLLLHPAGRGPAGKTNLHNESVHIDLDAHLWPLLAALRAAVPPQESLWDFTIVKLREQFAAVSATLALDPLGPQLYSLRHGGASRDLLEKRRSLEEVQRHGRWTSASCMRRYCKETLLQDAMGRVEPWVFEYGQYVEEHLTEVLEGGPAHLMWASVPARARQVLAAR